MWKIVEEKEFIKQEETFSMLQEESSKYYYGKEHDKIFRTVLTNKKDAIIIINKVLKSNFKEEDIEKYNSSFVNKIFQNKEADIVYKFKGRDIFFLIEHQTKIDYAMSYRILEYEMLIIKSAIDEEKVKKKEYKIPLVIPIVIYAGKRKWNANKYLTEKQETLENEQIRLGEYKVIDINDYTKEKLLQEEGLISKIMLLEKTKNIEETVQMIEEIIPKLKENDKELFKNIISIIFREKMGEEKAEKLIEKIEGDEKRMLAVVEMIRRENQMYINQGKREGKIEGKKEGRIEEKKTIIKNMIEENLPIELIAKITKTKKQEIEKLIKN